MERNLLNILLSLRKSRRDGNGCDECWSLEDRHLGDLPGRCVAGDSLNPKGLICALRLVGSIEGKGRLCIGGSRIQAPPATHPGPKWCDGENGANRFSSLIPRRDRWHTQNRVFFQECHNPVYIACLPLLHIAREQRARLRISTTRLHHLSLIPIIARSHRSPIATH